MKAGLVIWGVALSIIVALIVYDFNRQRPETFTLRKDKWECTSKVHDTMRVNNQTYPRSKCVQYSKKGIN